MPIAGRSLRDRHRGRYPRGRPRAMRRGRRNWCSGRTRQVFLQARRVSIGPARGFPHRAGQRPVLVVIEGIGSYGAGLSDRVLAAGFPVAEPAAMGSGDRRGVGKTDTIDAARIARSVLSVDIERLRRPRADGSRVAIRVLVVAREQTTCERTRTVNALTALVRTVELGVDARKSLS
ncbi:transposase, partial [Rhodococcus erythropolis]|uniref:IS110 family transposase n=1 Tax=Rhodococcus erythropolis TaxID=1833 RepID=UPI0037AE59DD